MKWDSQMQQWAIAGAVIVAVLLGGWWLYSGKGRGGTMQDTGKKSEQMNATQQTVRSEGSGADVRPTVSVGIGEEVHANDQAAGMEVRVSEARLSRVSWIAVRDNLRIFGAARVNPPAGGGTVTDVIVPLLRATEPGKTYMVVVYADDGDGIFDFKIDALVDGLDDTFATLAQ